MKRKQRTHLILSWLRRNARMSLTHLSRRTRVPISTLHDHLKTQEKDGVYRHVTLVDFQQLGYLAKANVLLKSQHKKSALAQHLQKSQHVNSLYRVNNGYDYLMECVCKDMKELEAFLEKLEIEFDASCKVFYVIDDVKKESFLSTPELVRVSHL